MCIELIKEYYGYINWSIGMQYAQDGRGHEFSMCVVVTGTCHGVMRQAIILI